MPGSSQSIAGVNTALNTAVAATLSKIADELDSGKDVNEIIVEIFKKHDRVIFNGNGYSDEWVLEAEKRGLPNLKSTVDAIPALLYPQNVEAYSSMNVLSKIELESRYEILLEEYIKKINIEMLTMLEMAKQEILPSCIEYINSLASGIIAKEAIGLSIPNEKASVTSMSELTEKLIADINDLEKAKNDIPVNCDILDKAKYYQNILFSKMSILRTTADKLETVVSKEYWPFPTYEDLLYRV